MKISLTQAMTMENLVKKQMLEEEVFYPEGLNNTPELKDILNNIYKEFPILRERKEVNYGV